MRVSIIGSGNVATVLGRLIKKAGHDIIEVTSKTIHHASILASELELKASDNIFKIDLNADIYIIAVSDNEVPAVCKKLKLNDKLVVHTSGAISKDVLYTISSAYGVLYPLQTLRKEIKYVPVIPLLIDANSDAVKNQLKTFALSLTKYVSEANDETRLKLHVAAVVTSNFTNHLYVLAKEYCNHENIDFNLLVPLIKEVAERSAFYDPSAMQTGPAARRDDETLKKHLELLKEHSALKFIYEVMSKSIIMNK